MNEPLTNGAALPPRLDPGDAPIDRAGFWRRLAAYVIDWIVLGILNLLVSIPINFAISLISTSSSLAGGVIDFSGLLVDVLGIIYLAVPALYFIWAYSSRGQTIGKAVLGINVVSIDGSPLTWRKGILRTLGYVPSTMIVLGFLWPLWDAHKQAWHDKIAGTCVVRASVPRERLMGTVDPGALRRSQRRWSVVLGVLTVLALALTGAVLFAGTWEVREMGLWPGQEMPPEEVAIADLTHLGLRLNRIIDARNNIGLRDGNYEAGAEASYGFEQQEIVTIAALRYSDRAAALSDFRGLLEWGKGNCGWYSYAYSHWIDMGVIRCGLDASHVRILWKGNWILDISAQDRGQLPAQELADQVRDAVATSWKKAR